MLSWQGGSLGVLDEPRNQRAVLDRRHAADDRGGAVPLHPRSLSAFIAPTLFHPKVGKLMFTGREHVFRSLNGGVNPAFPSPAVKEHCNLWIGDGDIDENGTYVPSIDVCDDWKAMGDPGTSAGSPTGRRRLVSTGGHAEHRGRMACPALYPWGDGRPGGHISIHEPSRSDAQRRLGRDEPGRVFVTTGHRSPKTWPRSTGGTDRPELDVDPQRYLTDIYVDTTNPYHAYISYSGYNQATPATPGHVFEVGYNPATGVGRSRASTARATGRSATCRSGRSSSTRRRTRCTPARTSASPAIAPARTRGQDAPGMPTTTIPYLSIDQENRVMYVTTHGFGAWTLPAVARDGGTEGGAAYGRPPVVSGSVPQSAGCCAARPCSPCRPWQRSRRPAVVERHRAKADADATTDVCVVSPRGDALGPHGARTRSPAKPLPATANGCSETTRSCGLPWARLRRTRRRAPKQRRAATVAVSLRIDLIISAAYVPPPQWKTPACAGFSVAGL